MKGYESYKPRPNIREKTGTFNPQIPMHFTYKGVRTASIRDGAITYEKLSPTLVIPADQIEVLELDSATYDDVQDFINIMGDRTTISGGLITEHSPANGTIDISAGTAWSKVSSSDIAVGKFFDFPAFPDIGLTNYFTNFIFLDYNEGTPQVVVSNAMITYAFEQDHILLGIVFRREDAVHIQQATSYIAPTHKIGLGLMEQFGIHRTSGMITTDGGTRHLVVSAGVVYRGLHRGTTLAFDTGNGDTFSYWYTADNGATWIEVETQSVLDNAQYNDITAGLSNLTSNRYGVHWVFMDADGTHLHTLYGQGDYTAAQAEAASIPSMMPNLLSNFCVLIAKIVNQEGTDVLVITYPWTTIFTSSMATDHGNLAGLGDNDHPQYLLVTDIDDIPVDAEVAQPISSNWAHDHNARDATASVQGHATATQITKLDGIEATADVTDAVNIGTSIHGVAAKDPPIDADKVPMIDTAASNVLKTSTWTVIKAFLKTYFDTLYNLYVHPNHSGDVTSVADGAQSIVNKQTVTFTAPITSTQTISAIAAAAPTVSIPAATAIANGYATSVQITKLDGIDAGADVTADNDPKAHKTSHAVGGADNVFPADPGADKYLMWDDDPGELVWAEGGGGGADPETALAFALICGGC